MPTVQIFCRTQLRRREEPDAIYQQCRSQDKCPKSCSRLHQKNQFIFFTKTITPTASSSTSTLALIPTHLLPKLPIHPPLRLAFLPGDLPPVKLGEALSASTTLLNWFKAAIDSLPLVVPVGIDSDKLAAFSGNPAALIGPDDEPWEILDQVMNRLVGYAEGISSIIRRGQFGMDGMYNWVHACIEDLHINEPSLEGKIQWLIAAMEFMYVLHLHLTQKTFKPDIYILAAQFQ